MRRAGQAASHPAVLRALAVVVSVVLMCGVGEVGSYFAVSWLSRNPRTQLLFYHPPRIPASEYEAYLKRRDPVLGWPPPEHIGGERYDQSGARRSSAFPMPGGECVTLYGDSFTYASDVDDAVAWSNVLAGILNCRVGNFGVGGYGTDQAFLRFQQNERDLAPVTILGIHPTDAVRNLTRDGYLAFGAFPASFKPRFRYVNGKIALLPIPTVPTDRLDDFARHPERYLPEDTLAPGTRYGPVRAEFPFLLALARVAFRPDVGNWLRGKPSWMNFYTPGDPSAGLEVMEGIVEEFAAVCARRAKRCVVLLFPTPKSHEYLAKTGRSPLESLVQRLEGRGIGYLDLSWDFAEALADRRFCDVVDGPASCAGHFNAEGNRLVAQFVHRYLMGQPEMRARLVKAGQS